ncbi:MAG: alpha-glucan family phosphorylase [Armatimonadetes bacterium]|nr:alpha-glucan family phosphorylase [Armatimonadota bacterium]MBX3109430.1 alpha-glucan family phosphorylase [Fimbriimonadaceae bacterium]
MRTLKYAHSFEVFRELPPALQDLRALALNLRWTWHHETQELFEEADRELWTALEHNPIELINQISAERLTQLTQDGVYLAKLGLAKQDLDGYMAAETWFDRKFGEDKSHSQFAYFCAEFGIHECLPIYSGGLGILAGDHLKAASDLGLPLVGVGLLYSRGYFRQFLNSDNWQTEKYPQYDFHRLPLVLERDGQGNPRRVKVEFPDRPVTCQIWRAQVGRVPLFLLDSNILENEPGDQGITDTLYGGDEEMRIRQETILGIGGFRALGEVGYKPTVCHMNEGHAAFLSLERLRQFMAENNCDLRTARQCVVSGNVFTTHTPVPAGFDIFQRPLLERYMSKAVSDLGLPFDQFLRFGRINKENKTEPFNMAILAMENSNYVNGVSKLHAEVTREMFSERWPHYPLVEVPIGSVTNGIHTSTFMSKRMVDLFDRHFGSQWREDVSDRNIWERIDEVPDLDLWELRDNQRGDFVRFVRRHLRKRMQLNTASPMDVKSVNNVLDPRTLTIGFARRFATYKRATLLFKDVDRLMRLMHHTERPVQFVFAGKAHPRDDGGKKLIQDIVNFCRTPESRGRMVFLEDYDMHIAKHMVQGVDLWLNNPRRPMEASGTSGMKVVPNGGLNCSILDGWWAEGFQPGAGWAIGDGTQDDNEGHQDWLDSLALYDLIEHEIAPTFYYRTENGLPTRWLEMMKRSMAEMAPTFSTLRMVREYCSRFYVPASRSFSRLTENGLERAKHALVWRDRVAGAWDKVRVAHVSDEAGPSIALGSEFEIHAEIELGDLQPSDVRVQALVGRVKSNRELTEITVVDLEPAGSQGLVQVFKGRAGCLHPGAKGYLVRVVPANEDVNVPSELSLVAWEQG